MPGSNSRLENPIRSEVFLISGESLDAAAQVCSKASVIVIDQDTGSSIGSKHRLRSRRLTPDVARWVAGSHWANGVDGAVRACALSRSKTGCGKSTRRFSCRRLTVVFRLECGDHHRLDPEARPPKAMAERLARTIQENARRPKRDRRTRIRVWKKVEQTAL